MRYFLFIIIVFLKVQSVIAQVVVMNAPLDTTSYISESNAGTWFKGILKDTIVHYKKVTIDTIICNKVTNKCDTVYFVKYYDLGWRYIADTLFTKDYRIQQHGYIYKNKRAGLWDLTGSPDCFEEGTMIMKNDYYFDGEILPGRYADKYYFLNDSISGIINEDGSYFLDSSKVTSYFTCKKNDAGEYICSIKTNDGLSIAKVPLKYLNEEVNLILSGTYNREIKNSQIRDYQ